MSVKSASIIFFVVFFNSMPFVTGSTGNLNAEPNGFLVDSLATPETVALFKNLVTLSSRKVLFGHQDATAYGIGWWAEPGRSDVKEVCGAYPAVYGWDLGDIHKTENLDGVNFEFMKERIREAYSRGGINTISLHLDNPKTGGSAWDNTPAVCWILPGQPGHEGYLATLDLIAGFLKDLKTDEGTCIPVILRPYHEHNHNWPWWGNAGCTIEEYNSLWRMTVDYLTKNHDIHHLLFALSPQDIYRESDYLERYPGDDYVDVLGLDYYMLYNEGGVQTLGNALEMTSRLSENRGKVSAVTETGWEGIPVDTWWTDFLLASLKYSERSDDVAWALVWRNANINHHFAPYPGHASGPDFIDFYNDPLTCFEDSLPDMYTFTSSDTDGPRFLEYEKEPYTAWSENLEIEITTNEPAALRYDMEDLDWNRMSKRFDHTGGLVHTTCFTGKQGLSCRLFIRARDFSDNESALMISFTIDTLQRPVYWYDLSYDDSDWQAGLTPVGFYGDADAQTIVKQGTTTYFRKIITVPDPESIQQMVAFIRYDNGYRFFLNGAEISRQNLADGKLDYHTWALSAADNIKAVTLDSVTCDLLVPGDNLLAVEIHQSQNDSLDLNFDFQMIKPEIVVPFGDEWAMFSGGSAPVQTITGVTETKGDGAVPAGFELYQNYPNPFNAGTVIRFLIRAQRTMPVQVELDIYDVLGRKLVNLVSESRPAGEYSVHWDADSFPSGLYYARMKAKRQGEKDVFKTRKMILIR